MDCLENMEIYDRLRDVPQNAQKQIGAGRLKGMTDINPMWRIARLTEMFGPVGIVESQSSEPKCAAALSYIADGV